MFAGFALDGGLMVQITMPPHSARRHPARHRMALVLVVLMLTAVVERSRRRRVRRQRRSRRSQQWRRRRRRSRTGRPISMSRTSRASATCRRSSSSRVPRREGSRTRRASWCAVRRAPATSAAPSSPSRFARPGTRSMWSLRDYIMRSGHAYVEIGSNIAAINNLVKPSNPSRYEALNMPAALNESPVQAGVFGHVQELIAQGGMLLKANPTGGPFDGFDVRNVILAGCSEQGLIIRQYMRDAHPVYRTADGTSIYDGYFPACVADWPRKFIIVNGVPFANFTPGPIEVPVVNLTGQMEVENYSTGVGSSGDPTATRGTTSTASTRWPAGPRALAIVNRVRRRPAAQPVHVAVREQQRPRQAHPVGRQGHRAAARAVDHHHRSRRPAGDRRLRQRQGRRAVVPGRRPGRGPTTRASPCAPGRCRSRRRRSSRCIATRASTSRR